MNSKLYQQNTAYIQIKPMSLFKDILLWVWSRWKRADKYLSQLRQILTDLLNQFAFNMFKMPKVFIQHISLKLFCIATMTYDLHYSHLLNICIIWKRLHWIRSYYSIVSYLSYTSGTFCVANGVRVLGPYVHASHLAPPRTFLHGQPEGEGWVAR